MVWTSVDSEIITIDIDPLWKINMDHLESIYKEYLLPRLIDNLIQPHEIVTVTANSTDDHEELILTVE